MSVDTRLRTGLRGEADQAPEVDLVDSWTQVLDRHDRDVTRRRTWAATAVLAAAAAVALVVILLVRPSDHGHLQPAPSPSTSATPTSRASEDAGPALEGKWAAGPVKAQQIVDHLEAVGLGRWATAVLEGTRPDQDVRYSLILRDGRLVVAKAVDDGASEIVDVQSYEVQNDRVAFQPEGSACRTVLACRVSGDTLRLSLRDDTCRDYRGTPNEAYMHASYVAVPFTRIP